MKSQSEFVERFLESLGLFQGKWEEWEVKDPYEGMYQGIHFNAVNIRLYHVYKAGHIRDGYEKRKEVVFKGLVIRYEDAAPTVLKTDHDFASIAYDVDVRDIDAVKKSYIASLEEMKRLLK